MYPSLIPDIIDNPPFVSVLIPLFTGLVPGFFISAQCAVNLLLNIIIIWYGNIIISRMCFFEIIRQEIFDCVTKGNIMAEPKYYSVI